MTINTLLFSIIFLNISLYCDGQVGETLIHYSHIDQLIVVDSIGSHSILTTDSTILNIELEDYSGACSFLETNLNGDTLVMGQYKKGFNDMTSLKPVDDLGLNKLTYKLELFNHPIRDGEWIYFENGKIEKKVSYDIVIIDPRY